MISNERQREILEGTRQNAEEQRLGYQLEKRVQEQLLARAQASTLRLAKYTPKGGVANAAKAIKERLMQLEFDIERTEVTIQEIDADLSALPEEEDGA